MGVSIEKLRAAGYKVRIHHHRLYRADGKVVEASPFEVRNGLVKVDDPTQPLAHGGKTVVELTTPNGVNTTTEAQCSDKDNFCYKVGAAVALGRALKNVEYYDH